MFRRVPIVGHPIAAADLLSAFLGIFDRRSRERFAGSLKTFIGSGHVFLLSSGTACFYVVLKTLRRLCGRDEVILPAYTASSLVVAVQKAGLKPVLCDISLEDFNMDLAHAATKINERTLCIVPVHMFGIPWGKIKALKKEVRQEVFIVEDCAQAFGAWIEGRPVGTFGDIGFFSFNRGKNLPTVNGGCIATDSGKLAGDLLRELEKVPGPGLISLCATALKLKGLYLAYKPFFYRLLHLLILMFKENSIPKDFKVERYTHLQAAFGFSLLKNIDRTFKKRTENGLRALAALSGLEGLLVPRIGEGLMPVFSRLPVVFKDVAKAAAAAGRLEEAGIDASRFYLKPLHHLFDLGYKKDDFPNAAYLAERLLTLPVHPLVTHGDIETMARVIDKTVNG